MLAEQAAPAAQPVGDPDRHPARLEQHLGDPWQPESAIGFAPVLAAAQRGELLGSALPTLTEWGVPAALVPATIAGGGLRSVADSFELLRVLARRDPQLAVAYGSTFLGSVPVWLFGAAQQQRWLADQVLAGVLGGCAISERDHGSDLARNEFRAEPVVDGYRLRGEKWPIGNGQRGGFVTVLAGTGVHSLSLLLLDKQRLSPQHWRTLPRAATIGLSGHDLSGLAFDDCPVPADSLLGTAGTGMAQILKTLQVTRPLVSGISLGVLDTALRLTIDYARQRLLYGGSLIELPTVRQTLLRAYVTLLISECVAVPAARAISAAPDRMVRWSALVKYLVPALVEQALQELAGVLSARYYIQDELPSRVFHKLTVDHAAMGIFDGTAQVALATVAASLRAGTGQSEMPRPEESVAAELFDWSRPAPDWQPAGERFQLAGEMPDEIAGAWSPAVTAVAQLAGGHPAGADLLDVLEGWHAVRARQMAGQRALTGQATGSQLSPQGVRMARLHCLVHAAASCVQVWRYGHGQLPAPFDGADWLVLALQRLRQEIDGEQELSPRSAAVVEQVMFEQYEQRWSFSLRPYQLA